MSLYPTMEKEMARKKKMAMEPEPQDPRGEQLYPGMGVSEKVLDAVQTLRDKDWETLNDKICNNEPASPEELASLLEKKPWLNADNPNILWEEIRRNRQAHLLYSNRGEPSFEEIQVAKSFVIADAVTPEGKKKLEAAADQWYSEHKSWSGWEEKKTGDDRGNRRR